jgi:WD40 repeat protein
LVSGLPQRQIEQELKFRPNNKLVGTVAMTLGLELRRAYVNDLAVLQDGTCVSANDDGHVQLWKHAEQQYDVIHRGVVDEGGVDCVVALDQQNNSPSLGFATSGRGAVNLWTPEADLVMSLPTGIPGTTPDSLISLPVGDGVTCLAARFRITRQTNTSQFRLPPQNDAERRRRAAAEAEEYAIQQNLAIASRSVQLWYSDEGGNNASRVTLKSQILHPPTGGIEGSAPITCMTTINPIQTNDNAVFVTGDALGGVRVWGIQQGRGANNGIQFQQLHFYQLRVQGDIARGCSIVCMETLRNGNILVSTENLSRANDRVLDGATPISIPVGRGVHVLDFFTHPRTTSRVNTTLTGHVNDAVICMCELPNGDLLTGGGKLDATLQLWNKVQIQKDDNSIQETSEKTYSEVGYVFCLQALPDSKVGSDYYAVAAARYNTIKLVI